MRRHRIALPGSQRPALPDARLQGKSDPAQRIKVSIDAGHNPHSSPTPCEGASHNVAIFACNGGAAPDPRGGYDLQALKTNSGA